MAKTSKVVSAKVQVNYSPRPWQARTLPLLKNCKKTVLNVHRGGGKTWFCLAYLVFAAMMTRSQSGVACKFAYIGQSISHAKQTCWSILEFMLAEFASQGICSFNSNDLTIKFQNGNMIHLMGIENADKVRGSHFHGLVLDEAQECDVETYEMILAPTLRQNSGWAIVIGTPKGPSGIFYKLWLAGHDTSNTYWQSIDLNIEQTGAIPEEEWQELLKNTSKNVIQQEYYCSFEAAIENRVYFNYTTENLDSTIVDRGRDIYVGMDFNIGTLPMAIGQLTPDGKIEVFLEKILHQQSTQDAAQWLLDNFPDRNIIVCPDASGAQTKTSQLAGNDHTILRNMGLTVHTPRANPRVKDRIQAVNVGLRNALDEISIHIHPRCEELIKTMQFQEVNEYTGAPDKTKGLDHMGDALGYLVNILKPTQKPQKMKVSRLRF